MYDVLIARKDRLGLRLVEHQSGFAAKHLIVEVVVGHIRAGRQLRGGTQPKNVADLVQGHVEPTVHVLPRHRVDVVVRDPVRIFPNLGGVHHQPIAGTNAKGGAGVAGNACGGHVPGDHPDRVGAVVFNFYELNAQQVAVELEDFPRPLFLRLADFVEHGPSVRAIPVGSLLIEVVEARRQALGGVDRGP